jgi:hypothetical protein
MACERKDMLLLSSNLFPIYSFILYRVSLSGGGGETLSLFIFLYRFWFFLHQYQTFRD